MRRERQNDDERKKQEKKIRSEREKGRKYLKRNGYRRSERRN